MGKKAIPIWKLRTLWINRKNLIIEGKSRALILATFGMAFIPIFIDVGISFPNGFIKAISLSTIVLAASAVLFLRFGVVTNESDSERYR